LILYDKNGLFLGMGNQELYLLGYEDMEEFRNYHNDFADLFVNKPGFIFKFKNFSWIDYAQHSGTPNKRVLIRTKNGKEIESALNITEIFLPKEINGSSIFFSVELSNAPFKHDIPATSLTTADTREETPIQVPQINEEEPSLAEDMPIFPSLDSTLTSFETSTISQDYEPALITIDDDKPLIKSETEDAIFKPSLSPSAIDDGFDFKLKFDHTILETPSKEEEEEPSAPMPLEYDSIDQIQPTDLKFDDISLESYPEDQHEDLLSDQTLFVKELREEQPLPTIQEEPFDLSECADELGLDISTLAQIIEEYVETLTSTMPLLLQAIQDNNRHEAKEEIAKLKSIALHLHINALYNHFEHLETSLDFDTKEEILQTLHHLQNSVASFKETVL